MELEEGGAWGKEEPQCGGTMLYPEAAIFSRETSLCLEISCKNGNPITGNKYPGDIWDITTENKQESRGTLKTQ